MISNKTYPARTSSLKCCLKPQSATYKTSTAMDVRAKPMTAPARKATLKEEAQPDCVAPIVVLAFEKTATYRIPHSIQRSNATFQNLLPYSPYIPFRPKRKLHLPPQRREHELPNTKLMFARPDYTDNIGHRVRVNDHQQSSACKLNTMGHYPKLRTQGVRYPTLTNRDS